MKKGSRQGSRLRSNNISIVIALLLLVSASAWAAGPIYVYPESTGGTARTWSGGIVNWKYDDGPLSATIPNQPLAAWKDACEKNRYDVSNYACKMSNCGAVMCLEALFKTWQDSGIMLGDNVTTVKTSNITIANKGPVGEDIDASNFSMAAGYFKQFPAGTILVVFDKDGEFFKDSPTELGRTQLFYDQSSQYYTGGWIVLNGKKSGDANFSAAVLHELGHVLGLDHSQPQHAVFSNEDNQSIAQAKGLTTMYPVLLNSDQLTLHYDDVVSLAQLYPSSDFTAKFCRIEGDMADTNNNPYMGINVIAYADDSQFVDARSFVTGAWYAACGGANGHYVLPGIVPGVPYHVVYEPVFPDLRNFTHGLNPYDDNCLTQPALEDSGFLVTSTGKAMATCNSVLSQIPTNFQDADSGLLARFVLFGGLKGNVEVTNGQTIKMAAVNLPVGDTAQEPDDNKKKGWCMSVAGGVNPAWGLLLPALVGIFVLARKKHATSSKNRR